MFLRFAYPQFFWFLVPLYLLLLVYRFRFYQHPRYVFPLAGSLAVKGFGVSGGLRRRVLFALRAVLLAVLIFFVARPQWVDERSTVHVDAVDIVIALDVSESMQAFDDLKDRRSRLEVAKAEAIRFVDKRMSDPIGLVLFGAEAVSRAPLTLDKFMLKDTIGRLTIGVVDGAGTALGTGLSVAINRLKTSKSKSKIVVLLTDGVPTPRCDRIDPVHAIDFAKELGIKVYTVGIGNDVGGYVDQGFYGISQAGVPLNVTLLERIARETGGKFFRAKNPTDMRNIYDTIDKLEKTDLETNLYSNYYEAFLHFIWIVFLLLALEYCLRLFVWRGI